MVKNIYEALNQLTEILESKGFRIVRKEARNFKRHYLITASYNFKLYKLYLIFQREPFHSFSKYFKGDGDALAIDRAILASIVRERVNRVIWCLEDGSMYMENPKYIFKLAVENGWFRETAKTGESVANIPIKYLKQLS